MAARERAKEERESVRAAKKAALEAERAAKKGALEAERAAKKGAKAEVDAAEGAIRAQKKATAEKLKAIRDEQRARERSHRDFLKDLREQEREAAKVKREQSKIDREMKRADRDARRVAEQDWKQRLPPSLRSAGAVASGVYGAGSAAAGVAGGLLGEVARGAGVQTDLSTMARQGFDLESAAVELSNAGYMPGTSGASGIRQSPKELVRQARSIASETASDPTQVIEGLRSFVLKTGDLETGREILKDMAVLSKATGTNLEDMVDAAGDVSTQFDGIPDKAKRVAEVMRAIAGQGKLGAVEIRDLAVQMAKIGAAASQFKGDPSENMIFMGALAQLARKKGGAATATQAATSVQGFVNTFKTPARVAAFKERGVDVYDENGQMRGAEDILMDALKKTGKSPTAFKKLFANMTADRAVTGLRVTYARAGGGEAGLAAAKEELETFKSAAMGAGEVLDSFNAAIGTTESRAQKFNNALSESATQMSQALLPALVALSPVVIKATKSIADWIADFTGSGDSEQSKENAANDVNTANVTSRLKRGIMTGEVNDGTVDFARKVLSETSTQVDIATKARDAAREDRKKAGKFGWKDVVFGPMAEYIFGDKEEADRKVTMQQNVLDSKKDSMSELASLIEISMDKVMSKVMRVEVVNAKPGGKAPVSANANGAAQSSFTSR
jgi:hypothetical protein